MGIKEAIVRTSLWRLHKARKVVKLGEPGNLRWALAAKSET